jgi:Sjoegren syndrome nuclear autoantigen 1
VELQQLTRRLAGINESLAKKLDTKGEYDKVIQETEAAYLKILESSQTLLTVLKRESVSMTKRSGRAA